MTLSTFNRVWCKVMLQRYMGAWLDNNLSVDQLSLELANGCLELDNLDINTKVSGILYGFCKMWIFYRLSAMDFYNAIFH